MSTIAENLSHLMAKAGINPIELSRKTKVSQPTLHKILAGKSKKPRPETLRRLAKYFKVDVIEITSNASENQTLSSFRLIPILQWNDIKAWLTGDKSVAEEVEKMPIKKSANQLSFATFSNDNVIPNYKNGTVLVFDPSITPKEGSLVLVEIGENKDILLRQLVLDVNKKYIQSLNPILSGRLSELSKEDSILATLIQATVPYEDN
jgi:transcriptional regulator with XRE-family HTH domain